MFSNEFEKKLSHFPNLNKHFGGVYSSDTNPLRIRQKSFIICNTDVQKGSGKHWYCIVKLENSTLECFDSLGIDSQKKEFLKSHFHQKNIKKIKFNVTQVQSSLSNTCGMFVLYFIIHRFHNQDLTFTELVNTIFEKNIEKNEILVTSFVTSHFENE